MINFHTKFGANELFILILDVSAIIHQLPCFYDNYPDNYVSGSSPYSMALLFISVTLLQNEKFKVSRFSKIVCDTLHLKD